MLKKKLITFAQAVSDGLKYSMQKDRNLICYGLGVTDPKGVFGTTEGLRKKFGKERVFDVPASENALTGIAIGASLNGTRSVVTHQRLDFFLLAMDQLVNSAAKWHYMFGSQISVPITIRLILGRGWGQGPTHSQNLQAWFNHIPGLKIVSPTHPEDAKGLLISSIFDPNPVIFLEHRWLHGNTGKVKEGFVNRKIGKCRIVRSGNDLTIISTSYLTLEAIKAANFLKENFNINLEIIDLLSIKPMDYKSIFKSVEKTKRVLVLDPGFKTNSIATDIIAKIVSKFFKSLKCVPSYMAMPDIPEPTGFALTKDLYINHLKIIQKILRLLKIKENSTLKKIKLNHYHDQPEVGNIDPF